MNTSKGQGKALKTRKEFHYEEVHPDHHPRVPERQDPDRAGADRPACRSQQGI